MARTKIYETKYTFVEKYSTGGTFGGQSSLKVTAKNLHDAIVKAMIGAKKKHESSFVNDDGRDTKVTLNKYELLKVELICESDY